MSADDNNFEKVNQKPKLLDFAMANPVRYII